MSPEELLQIADRVYDMIPVTGTRWFHLRGMTPLLSELKEALLVLKTNGRIRITDEGWVYPISLKDTARKLQKMATTTQRLEELLAAKDEEIESLREELEELQNKQQHHEFDLQQARGGYFLPFEEPDDGVSVVPRLEWRCENLRGDWGVTIYRCFLVQKHFLDDVLTFWPIYYTKQVSSNSMRAPWEYSPPDLPRRDGVHAEHDSGHLRVPLYLRTPTGLMPLNSHVLPQG